MKRILVGFTLVTLLVAGGFSAAAFAAAKDDIQMVDGKLSIQATAMPLRQFLQLLDAATGMTSKVPPALANEKISVRLEGLDLAAAIRKSFQGQPWNYFVAAGKGITIIDKAQAAAPTTGGGISSPVQPSFDTRSDNPPPPVPVSAPIIQTAPAPANAAGNNPSTPAALNLPPAQGGPAPAATPVFQPIGGTLGAPLPGTQPAR